MGTIFARKAMRAVRAALPAVLLPLFAVCILIPGPFDEIAMILTSAILIAVQPVRARRAMSAWRGGKSHRAFDARREG